VGLATGLSLALVTVPVVGFCVYNLWRQKRQKTRQNAILVDMVNADGVAARIERLREEAEAVTPDSGSVFKSGSSLESS